MSVRNVLITGGTDGIGKALAYRFASNGDKVIIIGRNSEKGFRVQSELTQSTGNQDIHFFSADLSLLSEVRRVTTWVESSFTHLDILINNAGGYYAKRYQTAEGFELTFALNYLSPFLLTLLLLPKLARSQMGARIINNTSIEYKHGKVDFSDLQKKKSYVGLFAYQQSKLALVIFTRELAQRLQSLAITVNTIHPGIVKTKIAQFDRGLQNLAFSFLKHTIAIPPQRGAGFIYNLVTNSEYKAMSGQYFEKSKRKPLSRKAMNAEIGIKLWKITEFLIGCDFSLGVWDKLFPHPEARIC